MPEQRIDIAYETYRIIAAAPRGRPTAFVYAGAAIAHRITCPDLDDCVERAKAWVDKHRRITVARRRAPHIGTADEYRLVFDRLPISAARSAMLRAHANAPDRRLSASGLAKAVGYDHFQYANSDYGKLAHAICDVLRLTPLDSIDGSDVCWTTVLASYDTARGDDWGRGQWQMHHEVAEALRSLNMA